MKHLTRLLTITLISGALTSGTVALAGASGTPGPINPTHNFTRALSPSSIPACSHGPTSVACTQYYLALINHARRALHEAPMILPTNWYRLTLAEQLLVVVNLERLGYHYPPYLGLNATLTRAALVGARRYTDPWIAAQYGAPWAAMNGEWTGRVETNALTSDYSWMYDDGWGGSRATTSNIYCTTPRAAGCWGHRDTLMGWTGALVNAQGTQCTICEMGAAYAPIGGGSQTVLIAVATGTPPPMYFTWSQETRFFPRGLPYVTPTPIPPGTVTPGGPGSGY